MNIDIIGNLFFGYFPGRVKYAKPGKPTGLTFRVPVPKVVEVIP